MHKRFGAAAAIVLALAAFLVGYDFGANKSGRGASSASGTFELANTGADRSNGTVDFDQFWDLWEVLQKRYVRQPVDEKALFYGALQGMVASLGDPYSVYLPPAEAEEFAAELSGKFEGIGAEIGLKNGFLVIIAPLADSPAERAGLQPGDRILAIDGADTFEMSLDEAVSHIRGTKGTVVKLHVLRGDAEAPTVIEITRDTIRIESVKLTYVTSPAGKRLAVVKVSHFNEDTHPRFVEIAERVKRSGADGLILDLRSNPGGFLETSIRMLGEWIPGEVAVSERFSDQQTETHRADGRGRLKEFRTVVLINGGSASASEIVAGALHDQLGAVLIGTQTFGKGSVQDLVQFPDGSSAKFTVAEWLTPKGVNINENGIAPDYAVERTEEDYNADRDPQLDAARGWFDGVLPPVRSATSTPS